VDVSIAFVAGVIPEPGAALLGTLLTNAVIVAVVRAEMLSVEIAEIVVRRTLSDEAAKFRFVFLTFVIKTHLIVLHGVFLQ